MAAARRGRLVGAAQRRAPVARKPDQLFRADREPDMSCDEWLGQQVVLFDRNGISLREIIRTVVTFEGAHSINTSRLSTIEGRETVLGGSEASATHPERRNLFGIRYAHLIVIESAMYLYDTLLDQDSIVRPKGEIYSVNLGVECTRDQAESPQPRLDPVPGNDDDVVFERAHGDQA